MKYSSLIFIVVASLALVFTPTHAQTCTGSLPTQLAIDSSALVISSDALNLRDNPENGAIISTLPTDSVVNIFGGPVCGVPSGLRWWQVERDGVTGWAAEADLSEYWLEPYQPVVMFMGAFDDEDDDDEVATEIPQPTPAPTEVSAVSFENMQSAYEDDGVGFWLDLTVRGYNNQDVAVYLWFFDLAADDYLSNPNAHADYINNSDTLYVSQDIRPTGNTQSIQLFIPFDQFPVGDYEYYPQVTVYDDDLELLGSHDYDDMLLSYQAPGTGVSVHDISVQFAEEGVWYLVDMTVNGHANEELTAYVWLWDDVAEEYIENPIASADHLSPSGALHTDVDLVPESDRADYTGTDVALYLPYYEFPTEYSDYMPFVAVYDDDNNKLGEQLFEETVLSPSDHPFPSSGVLIRHVEPIFEDAGIRYIIDLETRGYEGQMLDVVAHFSFYDDEFVYNALDIEGHYQSSDGDLFTYELVERPQASQRVSLYVPYNVFPAGSYSYFPVITIYPTRI